MQAAIKAVEKESRKKIRESLKSREEQIARHMLKDGQAIEKVRKWTGLNLDTIKRIK